MSDKTVKPPKVKRTDFAKESETTNPNFDPSKFQLKSVTLPLWKWQDGVTKYFTIDGQMKLGRVVQKAGKDGAKMEPATVAPVTRLDNNTKAEIICGAVLKSTLEDTYADHSYVGKSFAVTQSEVPGKRYRAYSVSEITN